MRSQAHITYHAHPEEQRRADLIKAHFFKRYRTYIYIHTGQRTLAVYPPTPPFILRGPRPHPSWLIKSIPAPRYEFDIYKHIKYTAIKKVLDKEARHAVPARCRCCSIPSTRFGAGKEGYHRRKGKSASYSRSLMGETHAHRRAVIVYKVVARGTDSPLTLCGLCIS